MSLNLLLKPVALWGNYFFHPFVRQLAYGADWPSENKAKVGLEPNDLIILYQNPLFCYQRVIWILEYLNSHIVQVILPKIVAV